ncbi:MAG: anthranilate synthase component I family protein [Proteobacteria bacterium]|nr:MAG: anthranilate synthase component I family protein [Pseudomonadota bacterium]
MYFLPELAELKETIKNAKTDAGVTPYLPISVELPADALTPVTAFLRLRATGAKKMFLLESADGGEQVGRYSFLGIDPFASLKSVRGTLRFEDFETSEVIEEKTTFDRIGDYLSRYKTPLNPSLPPFMGGALGYFAYDCVRFLENIPLPDEGYGTNDLHFMFFKTILVFDRLRHRLHLVHLLAAKADGLDLRYQKACDTLQHIKERLTHNSSAEEVLELSFPRLKTILPVEAESTLGKDRYCQAVKIIKEHIRAGDIFQCVLSDRFHFPVKEDSFLIYRILRMINPSPYLYFLEFGDETLLGASPEMLIRTQDRSVETCPIAGTRPRGKSEEDDLKMEKDLYASVKERAEHLMLVDLGRNDIGRVSKAGTVKVKSFMQVERYSHVMHLVSRVSGTLKKEETPWKALGSCFPAGTLSGAPKIKAMQIISRLEGSQRGPYGGAIICQDFGGDLNTCITIRSLYVRDGVGYAQAGAGIVADSQAEKEYEEVLNKARAVRTAVAAAREVSR